MDYHLHSNGWTVLVDNLDLRNATQDDINLISKLIASNTLVVLREQNLSIEEELRVVNMFKDPERLFNPNEVDYKKFVVANSDGKLIRVTGEENEEGEEGFWGHVRELDWHCNGPQDPNKKPLIWLYGVKGTVGSKTSWNNNVLSYEQLDPIVKEQVSNLKSYLGYDPKLFDHEGETYINTEYTPGLVYTNKAGKQGLFFPPLQIFGFVGMAEEENKKLIKYLTDHTLQDKFCYHHDWQDGDVVIADQWLGVHKRWRFEGMSTRVLHRAAVDYPDQDYSL